MRKRQAKKRPLLPDPKFNDQLVTRFVNMVMWDGKKSVAFKIFYDAMDIVEERNQDEEKTAIELWKEALSNVMPHVEVRSRRVGGATFQIPMQIRPDRKVSLAMKWLISFARKRNEKSMALRLANEVLAAAKEEGAAVKKRVDTHKMAEANKAFSHFNLIINQRNSYLKETLGLPLLMLKPLLHVSFFIQWAQDCEVLI